MCPWILVLPATSGICTNPTGLPLKLYPPPYRGDGNQPCGSSEGQPDKESLCPHRSSSVCPAASPWPLIKPHRGSLFQAAGIVGRACTGPQQSCDHRLLPPCSNPLQKHNLNNSFHVKLWSEPRFVKLLAFKMWLFLLFWMVSLTNPKPSYQSTKIYWAFATFHFISTNIKKKKRHILL